MLNSFEQAKDEIAKLVKHFGANKATYIAPAYKEAHARQEFIDPLFMALNWDVQNRQHAAPDYREVVAEDSLDIEGQRKAPDYAFRVGRERKFFAEAKKPGVDLKTAAAPAYQLRRYAWSAKLPLSILTDFEELAVYDCRIRPAEKDKPSVARVNYFQCEEYADRWREVWEVFSRDAVWGGSFDQYTQTSKGKRGTSEVDAEFLKEIEGWRDALAKNIALRNARLTIDELNDAVQRTIDRLIFLRMAEDRGIEDYGQLQRLALTPPSSTGRGEGSEGIYAELLKLSRKADAKYNSGLFDFSKTGDTVTPKLTVDDKALRPILAALYYPQSPYEFSVLPAEILGNIYEQFLGKTIRLTASHQAKVEEKPEVKKAGGVYYTPAYIVEYIVKHTVGKQIEGKSPMQLKGFRVLDPACGSGSFLLGAFTFLLDYYHKWHVENSKLQSSNPQKDEPLRLVNGVWRLTTAEKKRILTEHIFGVDIDRQAVEVTKLSLLLKVLEGESDESLGQQLRLFQERALPNLDHNIKCGNSLIGPDYFSGQLMADPEELRRVNPFDWAAEFPQVFALTPPLSLRERESTSPSPQRGEGLGVRGDSTGFDCVIGNPPWGGDIDKDLSYFHSRYPDTTQDHTDSFKLFIEKAIHLLCSNGLSALIVPNTILRQRRLKDVRVLLLKNQIASLIDLGEDVFKGVVAPSCIFVAQRSLPKAENQVRIANLARTSNVQKAEALLTGVRLGEQVKQRDFQNSPDLDFVVTRKFHHASVVALGEFDELECKDAGINYQRVGSGMQDKGKSDLADRLLYEGKRKNSRDQMYWKGADIDRYWIADTTERFCRPNYKDFIRASEVVRLNNEVYGTAPKIILRQTADRIISTIDYKGVWFGRSIIAILVAPAAAHRVEYFLGLLNSKYFKWLYDSLAQETGRVFAQVKLAKVKQLPIRPINFNDPADKARHDRMVSLVEQMLELHKRKAGAKDSAEETRLQRVIDSTDKQIDALVYELYSLTADEIAVVESASK
ncbi:MAG: restriction endonuclease subunit M [Chloroflexi bacterium]|nr:restriction endonuclease subunit M [Chloroflexota bacterium]